MRDIRMRKENLDMEEFQEKAKDVKCLVVGDIILDKYISGKIDRISPEAPIPVIHITNERYVLGGAANVAGNICGYHIKTLLCGRIGKDSGADKVSELLSKKEIEFMGIISESNCTTVKTRVTGMNQQIVRIDEEDCSEISYEEEEQILHNIKQIIDEVNVIVLSDYNKGICTKRICENLIELCVSMNKPIIVDPKTAEWTKYKGATLITPNFKEFKEFIGRSIKNTEEEIAKISFAIMDEYKFKNLLVTRSQLGMTLVAEGKEVYTYDAVAQEVFDVSGAGDTVIATIAAFLAVQYFLFDAVRVSNHAAGFAVSKMGTYTVSLEEVMNFISNDFLELSEKIVSSEKLPNLLNKWREENKKIIFTNGCFDILHVGHITYLNQARRLGDKLIVGLNSDSSVKRNKGESRPINNQNDRAVLLAALQCVDIVVLFDTDTPYELIKMVEPNILVKGGDYKVEEVVGREFAKELKLLNFVEGYSTTNMIKAINK